jgi:Mn-containing catalase
MEALRSTFRKSMQAKEEEIQKLRQLLQNYKNNQSHPKNDKNSECDEKENVEYVENLEQENHFLRQEFEKIKKKYEQLVLSKRSSS